MNTETNFMSFENLTKLIEEHKKETHPYKKYEFDSTSYTLLLISINNLIKENQELKSQLKGTTHCFDEEEHEKLKKQLEEYKDKINWYENFEVNKTIDKLRLKHNTQQKEFIEYMNKTIEELECEDVDDEEMKGYLIQRIDTFKEILDKYEEIIGGIDDKI